MKHKYLIISNLIIFILIIFSCGRKSEEPAREYMPDMYRSSAYQVYSSNAFFNDSINARIPVKGTIPRGFMPYSYPNTEAGYEDAGRFLKSPFNGNKHSLQEGKRLYNVNCVVCHGSSGKGDGVMIKTKKYPPSAFAFNNQLKNLPEGKMFHSIHYGKNFMGSYSSELTQEERWEIVGYIKLLQNVKN